MIRVSYKDFFLFIFVPAHADIPKLTLCGGSIFVFIFAFILLNTLCTLKLRDIVAYA